MKPRLLGAALAISAAFAQAAQAPAGTRASSVVADLQKISIDPAQTFRVRELQLLRGDIKIYLTEGILSFATPLAGRTIAAVFTTADTEGGDGEVLVLPPQRSERASLTSFIKTPNLDEHFSSAVFFFSDGTAKELLDQIHERPIRSAADFAPNFARVADETLRVNGTDIDVRIAQAMLDNHSPPQGFFYGMIGGRNLGPFDVTYEPERFESVSLGRIATNGRGQPYFQLWSSFRPRREPAATLQPPAIRDYKIDTVIHPDLSMSTTADLQYTAGDQGGRVIALQLAARLRVNSATIDGKPAEVLQHESPRNAGITGAATFVLIGDLPLAPGAPHQVEITYQGSVVRQTNSGGYFVSERNAWYPFLSDTRANFDLTFHCPGNLRLVATGEPVSEDVVNGVRTVHRKTQTPQSLAGFNLGDYTLAAEDHGPYHIELYANQGGPPNSSTALLQQTGAILDEYSRRWMPLSIHDLAVSPIEGYFGQGFPGLIYLSNVSYLSEENRPSALRNPRLNAFFSDMLLPHEVAHQWWGNVVASADYRASWLMEAMANYAALQYLEAGKGSEERDAVLAGYRADLLNPAGGESAGPVDFGERLLNNNGPLTWDLIVYEKGAWIMHMLRQTLGDEAFEQLQKQLLVQFASKPLGNEDFRQLAAAAVSADRLDKTLVAFFDTWIYSSGIPRLALARKPDSLELTVSGVDEDFAADIPLRCKSANGKQTTHWVRASSGENSLDMPPNAVSCALPAQTDFLFGESK